jgi:hypothetical protein
MNDLTAPELPVAKREPLEVEIAMEAMPEPTVTDEQALEAFRRAGLTMVRVDTVRDLAAVGIYVKGVGVLKVQRGNVMVTQQMLREAMRTAAEHIEAIKNDKKMTTKSKTNDFVRTMGGLAGLAKANNESQRLAIEIESLTVATGAPVTDTPIPTNSFAPKEKIRPMSTTIHNHGPVQMAVTPSR